jgi:hypothetical protein
MLTASVVTVGASCSKSEGSDPESTGPTKQAVERLEDFGLTDEQATCIVDELGADTVVEATDLTALTESEQFQDASKDCLE